MHCTTSPKLFEPSFSSDGDFTISTCPMFDFNSPVGYAILGLVGLCSVLPLLPVLLARKFDYKNKHVLVTGGSSGIGLEVAREYLKKGANVSIMARDKKKLDAAKADLTGSDAELSKRVFCASGDTGSSLEAVEKALAPSIKHYGDVDVLVNCAGTSIAGAFDELDIGEFERMLKVSGRSSHAVSTIQYVITHASCTCR
jgi:3-dehydrosphinganine reductase